MDNNLETTIEGIFACGNVLQVHDLVDMVSAEAKRAGRNAVEYIKSRFGREIKKPELVKCISGENVNYIKPDFINKQNLSEKIIFTLRVSYPDRRILIQLKDQNNNVIYKKKKVYVIPSEMVEIEMESKELSLDSLKTIKIEIVPRPEVLIEED